ncbi:hypothetical protein [Dapis sp. BLCC M126]|uniref:hypothetical protein n=1 Tax=Dapis sp. BLCC M126 TaxID=3400189 RepID=UPI003CF09763
MAINFWFVVLVDISPRYARDKRKVLVLSVAISSITNYSALGTSCFWCICCGNLWG